MDIKILSSFWGHKHLPLDAFLDKVRLAGYHRIEAWVPDNVSDKSYYLVAFNVMKC